MSREIEAIESGYERKGDWPARTLVALWVTTYHTPAKASRPIEVCNPADAGHEEDGVLALSLFHTWAPTVGGMGARSVVLASSDWSSSPTMAIFRRRRAEGRTTTMEWTHDGDQPCSLGWIRAHASVAGA